MKISTLSAAVLAALVTSTASANIVYSVNHAVGAGSVVGSIETDGTLGLISSANIVSWTLTTTSAFLQGGSPATFGSGSGGFFNDANNGLLSATANDLSFDYSGGAGYLLFWASDFTNWYCLQIAGCWDFVGAGEAFGYGTQNVYAEVQRYSSARAFTDGNNVIPEPSLLALVSLGLFGIAASRRKQA